MSLSLEASKSFFDSWKSKMPSLMRLNPSIAAAVAPITSPYGARQTPTPTSTAPIAVFSKPDSSLS